MAGRLDSLKNVCEELLKDFEDKIGLSLHSDEHSFRAKTELSNQQLKVHLILYEEAEEKEEVEKIKTSVLLKDSTDLFLLYQVSKNFKELLENAELIGNEIFQGRKRKQQAQREDSSDDEEEERKRRKRPGAATAAPRRKDTGRKM